MTSSTTDVSQLDLAGAIARKQALERRLGEIRATGPAYPAERADLVAEKDATERAIGPLREAEKRARTLRAFAGIGTPLHESLVARFEPAIVSELEADALDRQTARDQRSTERRAAKAATAPSAAPAPSPSPVPPTPRVPPPTPPKLGPRRGTLRGPLPEVTYCPSRSSSSPQPAPAPVRSAPLQPRAPVPGIRGEVKDLFYNARRGR